MATDPPPRRRTPWTQISPSVRLTVDLQPGTDPIVGRLTGPGEETRDFQGWIGLALALTCVLDAARTREDVS